MDKKNYLATVGSMPDIQLSESAANVEQPNVDHEIRTDCD